MSFDDLSQEFIKESKTKLLKVKKINSDAILPSYNYPSDSGFDLYSTEEIVIPALGRALIPTGLSFQFSEGYEIQIRTKSGLAINQGIMVLNSPGTVDQGYSGEIKVPIFNTNPSSFTIKKNMKVAQAVLCPVVNGLFVKIEEVDTFEETDRGDNGFGSTGI
jgi:dUTP pyrophosphatase